MKTYRRDALLVLEADDEAAAQAKRFALALALAFNDLRDLAWCQEQLDKGRPTDPTAVDAYRGQWVGMSATFLRLASGLLAELGQLIHSNRSVIDSEVFRSAVQRIRHAQHRTTWDEMVKAFRRASNESGNESFTEPVAQFLNRVRNKAAFHYGHAEDCKSLMKGYAARFSGQVMADGNDALYVSFGSNAEGTRFYFADGAVVAWMQEARGTLTAEELRAFFMSVNTALRYILEGLLEHFAEASPVSTVS